MVISELRPDRHLIDENFNGYFLSLTTVPSYSISLQSDVDNVFASDEQYTYVHSKLFSLHNHLFYDPWLKNIYIVDKNWKVQKCLFNTNTGVLDGLSQEWEIPRNHDRVPGHFPITMLFPASDLVLLTDGAGTLHIVSRESHPWQVKYAQEVIGKEKPFLVMDCRCEMKDSHRVLHTLLFHIQFSSDDCVAEDDGNVKLSTFIEWISLVEESSKGWSLQCVRQLKGKTLPDYLALEPGCRSVFVVSEHSFNFISDTENPIVEVKEEKEKKKITVYMWQQSVDDIKLWLNLEEGTTKKDVKVDVKDLNLSLECKDKSVIKGELFHNIDHELTTWTLDENRLNVIFQKLEHGLMWTGFLKNNTEGEEILDESVVQEVHERLSHLCSDKEVRDSELFSNTPAFNMEQLEECDNFGESQILSRIDGTSHVTSHQYSLVGHQWLYSLKLNAESASAMCIRHDVHGCLWLPEPLKNSTEWKCSHLCTFPAFGYVHASKQNRKFSLCSTNMSFTVICEANSHIYIYYKDTTSDLRNRRFGNERSNVGRFTCLKMESPDSILGALAIDEYLFVLLKNKLYQYHVINS